MKKKASIIAAGIDVGASMVKAALVKHCSGKDHILALRQERIRRRDPREVVLGIYESLLQDAAVKKDDVRYVASTGEGELVTFRTGHFYGMTTHARGGLLLNAEARAVLDLGALHARAIKMDEHARVLSYRMTSQCASGSGQFLENIARYLGVTLDEVGELSQSAEEPEKISGICAVLAETDVINMVSRGISTANILRGIHESMAKRFVKLLRTSKATGIVMVTGGLANDKGLLRAMQDSANKAKLDLVLETHENSVYAGALGAAIWGVFRHSRLEHKRGRATEVSASSSAGASV